MTLIIPSKKTEAAQRANTKVFLSPRGDMVVAPRRPQGDFVEVGSKSEACDKNAAVKSAVERRTKRDEYVNQFKDHDVAAAYELKLEDAEKILTAEGNGEDLTTLDLHILDQEAISRSIDLVTLAHQVMAHYPSKAARQTIVAKELERVAWKQNQS